MDDADKYLLERLPITPLWRAPDDAPVNWQRRLYKLSREGLVTLDSFGVAEITDAGRAALASTT